MTTPEQSHNVWRYAAVVCMGGMAVLSLIAVSIKADAESLRSHYEQNQAEAGDMLVRSGARQSLLAESICDERNTNKEVWVTYAVVENITRQDVKDSDSPELRNDITLKCLTLPNNIAFTETYNFNLSYQDVHEWQAELQEQAEEMGASN